MCCRKRAARNAAVVIMPPTTHAGDIVSTHGVDPPPYSARGTITSGQANEYMRAMHDVTDLKGSSMHANNDVGKISFICLIGETKRLTELEMSSEYHTQTGYRPGGLIDWIIRRRNAKIARRCGGRCGGKRC